MHKDSRSVLRVLPVVLLATVGLVDVAHAYLDPGTGSYIVQILIGGLLGGLFAVGMFWRRFIAWVKGIFGGRKQDQEPPKSV